MMASMMPKYGDPIEAKRGAGLLKVLEPEGEGMGHPFVVVRAGAVGSGTRLY
jgi:hypothetical protein